MKIKLLTNKTIKGRDYSNGAIISVPVSYGQFLINTKDAIESVLPISLKSSLQFPFATTSGGEFTAVSPLFYNDVTKELSVITGYEIGTTAQVSNWNTAFSWGNHGIAGYVTGTPWTSMGYLTTTNVSGTANYISIFTAANTIGNSSLYETGAKIGLGTITPAYKFDVRGNAATDAISSDIGVNLNPVVNPTVAPTTSVGAGGSVNIGNHFYWYSYTTALGETVAKSAVGATVTTSGQQTVTVTFTTSTDARVTGRRIYRTQVGGNASSQAYLLATINNNIDTTYIDSLADTSLNLTIACYFTDNTTSKYITVSGTKYFHTGSNNLFIGNNAASALTLGGRNVVLGIGLGTGLSTGSSNVVIGFGTGVFNATECVSIGANSLNSTTGAYNIGIGSQAGAALTSGTWNTILGRGACQTGLSNNNYNTAIGAATLSGPNGAYNTALGFQAGNNLSSGDYNTFIGAQLYGLGTGIINPYQHKSPSNSVALGYNAYTTKSNQLVLGHHTITETLLSGNTYIKNETSLGTETLTNGNLTSGTSWARTNDCTLASDKATWTFSAGTASTLTQTSANLAITAVGGRWYKFVYTVSAVSGAIVYAACAITTSFASETTVLYIAANGTYTVYFRSTASPTDFVITATLTSGQAFTLDALSLKEVVGGDLTVGRNIEAVGTINAIGGFKANGTAPVADGTYTGFTSITTKGGIITAIS